MKSPGFFEGVWVALVASLAGSLLHVLISWVLPLGPGLRLLIALIGLGYIVYLIVRSRERVGRVTVLFAWLLLSVLIWLWAPPLQLYLLIHLGLIWLVRSLYYYTSLLSSAVDMGVVLLGYAAVVWSMTHTGTIFLTIWCLFLVQALFALIPAEWSGQESSRSPGEGASKRFRQAHRVAESAARRLYSGR